MAIHDAVVYVRRGAVIADRARQSLKTRRLLVCQRDAV